jgi:coenzyme F420-reducing hydrogenase alpha subunit
MARWTSKFDFPDFEQDYEFVALRHADEYPITEGRIVSNRDLDIALSEYDETFTEEHVEHSNALHSVMNKRGSYFVGPLARYNLNFDKFSAFVQQTAKDVGMKESCRNPFKSIIVRSLETLYVIDDAARIIDEYEMPDAPSVKIEVRAGTGYGCTEAPRGICYHTYTVDEKGLITKAKIVPPTSQNQKTIENDLREFAQKFIHLEDEKLTWQCEQAVRNYDPCISCATHFLRLKIERE